MILEYDDPVLRLLSRLPIESPNEAHAARTRARMREAIARRARAARRRQLIRRTIEPAAVGAFSILYLLALANDLLRWDHWP